MDDQEKDVVIETLVETENYQVLRASSDDGEVVYHVELFNVTLHFFDDEWREFIALITEAAEES
jgi:hypothetical protein